MSVIAKNISSWYNNNGTRFATEERQALSPVPFNIKAKIRKAVFTGMNYTLLNCDYCGKEFKKRTYTLKLSNKHFCSRKCHSNSQIINTIGSENMMNCGLRARVTKYINAHDIDVEFENGIIVKNTKHEDFKHGRIKCPPFVEYFEDYAQITHYCSNSKISFLVDIEDISLAINHSWSFCNGYIGIYHKKFHRLVMDAKNYDNIDHINGDKTDNRKSNLRFCNAAENSANRGKQINNTSGYKGVTWSKNRNKWIAQIVSNGNYYNLGAYNCKHEAAKIYNEAALKYHGEFARLNKIKDEVEHA